MEEVFDFTGMTKEDLDVSYATPGWYLVTCASIVQPDTERYYKCTFRVEGPEQRGALILHNLTIPRLHEKADTMEFVQKLYKAWASRLLFNGNAPLGQQQTGDWKNACGKRFVIHLKPHSYFSDKKGVQVESVQIAWAPYPLDHDQIPVDVRIRLGLPLLAGQEIPKEGDKKGAAKRKAKTDDAAPTAPAGGDNAKATDAVLGSLGL